MKLNVVHMFHFRKIVPFPRRILIKPFITCHNTCAIQCSANYVSSVHLYCHLYVAIKITPAQTYDEVYDMIASQRKEPYATSINMCIIPKFQVLHYFVIYKSTFRN